MKTKEEILKEFNEKLLRVCDVYEQAADNNFNKLAIWEKERVDIKEFISDLISKTREETIREEIAYWTDVFNNRPKNRDLESDNIAQNFARIEIERLENKLK